MASGLLCHMIMEFCLYLGTRKGTSKKSASYSRSDEELFGLSFSLVPMSKKSYELSEPLPMHTINRCLAL